MEPDKAAALGRAGEWDLCSSVSMSLSQNGVIPGTVYRSFSDGGPFPVFKTLMTNSCIFDCRYCENSMCRAKRFSYEPKELADVFNKFSSSGQVNGLFLSSGISPDADTAMEKMINAVGLIRNEGFKGYVHLKILPGASKDLIKQASEVATRLSINIEAPSGARLSELSSKDFDKDIIKRQGWIKQAKPAAGQTTQMVIGAGDETDLEILETADWEYGQLGLRRVYYSPFKPVKGTPLGAHERTPDSRVNRLYSVDFMMRRYGIPLKEFSQVMEDGNLPLGDPKVHLALERFDEPVDLSSAGLEDLIRIPGIGPATALRILALQDQSLGLTRRRHLRSIGVALRRAEPFVKTAGTSQKRLSDYGKKRTGGP